MARLKSGSTVGGALIATWQMVKNMFIEVKAYIDSQIASHDSQHSDAFLGISAKATDSDKLDGVQGSSFQRSDADDSVSGDINHTGAISYTQGNAVHVLRPQGATFRTTVQQTGAVKITLPVRATSTMMSMTVDIYDYSGDTDGESVRLHLGGYNRDSDGMWQSVFSTVLSGRTDKFYNVRFGNDGTKDCIWIGETDSVWAYPQVNVYDFYGGFNGATYENWADGWSVGFITSFGTVDKTRTSELTASHAEKLGGATLDTDTTLSGNSNSSVPTEKAVKTYADTKLSKSGGTMSGNLSVVRDNGNIALIEARGTDQGTGMFYAGQSSMYGGGFTYDGDGTPSCVGDNDKVTFFRRENGSDHEVFSYANGSSDVRFKSLVEGNTFKSTVGSGTAPFTVNSNTKVTNLNADLLDGCNADTNATISTIAQRNTSGDIFARLFRPTYQNQGTITGAMAFRVNDSSDNYIRFCSDTSAIRAFLDVYRKSDIDNMVMSEDTTITMESSTSEASFLSALSAIPKNLGGHQLTLHFNFTATKDFVTGIDLRGYFGGEIRIEGNGITGTVLNMTGSNTLLEVRNCNIRLCIYNIHINGTNGDSIQIVNVNNVFFSKLRTTGRKSSVSYCKVDMSLSDLQGNNSNEFFYNYCDILDKDWDSNTGYYTGCTINAPDAYISSYDLSVMFDCIVHSRSGTVTK